MQLITRHFRRQYYLHDGEFEHGPYTLEELRTKNLSPTSLIWHSRLKEWTKVADVAEVAFLINPPPPAPAPTDPASSPAASFKFAYGSSPGREDAGTAKSYRPFVAVGGFVLVIAVVVLFAISC